MDGRDARYFPILRGRQNELIAIRELASSGALGHIVPVVEPVRASTTLTKTLVEFFNHNATIGIVVNPLVGTFKHELLRDQDMGKTYDGLLDMHSQHVRLFYNVTQATTKDDIEGVLDVRRRFESVSAIVGDDASRQTAAMVKELQSQGVITTAITKLQGPLKRMRNGRILLDDGFRIPERNADYRSRADEFFSDGHSSYDFYGCVGFSDYSVVGSPFSSGGFSPRAVALHLTYFDEDDVRVRHFVSDPPDDTGNVPGKYGAAIEALYSWAAEQEEETLPRTKGLMCLQETYTDQRFPGLGSAKRFSIMHHLEMMNIYLEGAE